MNDAERWAISYFVLSFSAWADPLTGEKLTLSPQTKAALGSPDVRADHPRLALDPEREAAGVARANGKKPRVYYPGIRE
jgi:cytochrome c oxidase cbb3-type subunit 2